jgi:hypothetical protein
MLFMLVEAARRNFASRARQDLAVSAAFASLTGDTLTEEQRLLINQEFDK